jgi:hypothetical protein
MKLLPQISMKITLALFIILILFSKLEGRDIEIKS